MVCRHGKFLIPSRGLACDMFFSSREQISFGWQAGVLIPSRCLACPCDMFLLRGLLRPLVCRQEKVLLPSRCLACGMCFFLKGVLWFAGRKSHDSEFSDGDKYVLRFAGRKRSWFRVCVWRLACFPRHGQNVLFPKDM